MQNFFTSDSHYFHANIIRYCKRPFLQTGDIIKDANTKHEIWSSTYIKRLRAAEMTDFLIKRHNEVVQPDDTVWFLGDFCFGGAEMVIQLFRRLNGNYNIIWGNHDKGMRAFKDVVNLYSDLAPRIKFFGDMKEIIIDGQDITLCHYPMFRWNKSHKFSWMLHGHVHSGIPETRIKGSPSTMGLILDVGVDEHDYRPISFGDIKKIMDIKRHYIEKKNFTTDNDQCKSLHHADI